MTWRVRQVLDMFAASPGTVFTADAVYQTLVSRGTPVSLSCIYRITRQLSQTGLLACEPGRGGFGGGKHQFRMVQDALPRLSAASPLR
ncbi:MAG: transcriptional repressor [Polaromonas sp.]|nr:transcriptional repressor [Polaromonas sp.]